MSIKSEITRIKNNIKQAYLTCASKGVALPDIQNSKNLSSTIGSISGGNANKYSVTMDNILGDIDEKGKIQLPKSGILNATGVVEVDDYVLSCKFGGNAWGTTRAQGLSKIIFPDLKKVGNAAMAYFYTYSKDLETVSFPELEEIGQCGMQNAFQWNTNLKSVSFPKLKTLKGSYSSLDGAFYYCSNLEYVNLDSLEFLTSEALKGAFSNCRELKSLYFPSLTSESFGNYTNQFDGMLTRVTGCTVHFPFSLKNIISDWTSVIQGFGGTNTTIIFDLHTATLNFVTDDSEMLFGINGRKITGNSGYAEPEIGSYCCYTKNSNTLLIEKVNNLKADEVVSINVDEKLNQPSNKITISTGVSGLDVVFNVCGIKFSAIEEGNGNYVLNSISNGDEISYFVDGGELYSNIEGSFTTTGNNITINLNLEPANWNTFERPNLTSNGEMGGDSFAASDEGMSGTRYSAYHALNGVSSDYAWATGKTSSITFYNPKALKVSKLIVKYYQNSTTYQAKSIVVQGSNDNENWTDLAEIGYEAGISRNIEINSSKGYKYHKLTFSTYSTYVRITDISIVATYKE